MKKKKKLRKVGITGKYGPRYGAVVRKRARALMEGMKAEDVRCPRCATKGKLERVSTGIWHCAKCDVKFTGGAYLSKTERGRESFRIANRKNRELKNKEES
ncbi:MAG: 50S ribosomal protein L37ae [Promethearchaeia archaeon]